MVLVRKGRDLAKHLYCEVDGVAVKLRPQDLSLAGLFIPGADLSPVDREVRLVLHAPIGELAAKAQVVQVITPERGRAEGREPGTGLLFINLGDEDRAFVGLTLDALLRTSQERVPGPVPATGTTQPREPRPSRSDEPDRAAFEAKRRGRSEHEPARSPEASKRGDAGAYRHSLAEAPREIDGSKREPDKPKREPDSKRDAGAYRHSIAEAPRELGAGKRETDYSKRDAGAYRNSIAEAPRELDSSKRDVVSHRHSPAEALREPLPARAPDGSKREVAQSVREPNRGKRDADVLRRAVADAPREPEAGKREPAPNRQQPPEEMREQAAARELEAGKRDIAPNRSASPPEAAGKESPKKRSEEAEKVLRQLEQELAALQSKPAWAVLGLTPEPQLDAAKTAFLAMTKRYHPHAYARYDSPEVSKVATEIFIAHKKAFAALQTTLKSPAATTSGNAPLPNPGIAARIAALPKTSLRAPPVPQIVVTCDSAPATGVNVPQPSLRPKPAVRAPSSWPPPKHPSQPPPPRASASPPISARRASDAERAVAAGVKHLAASRFDDAAVEFERARALHPGGRDPELWLRVCHARHAKADGLRDETLASYREVLELDPEHREALDYVNSQAPRKRGGLIQKLFGPDDE